MFVHAPGAFEIMIAKDQTSGTRQIEIYQGGVEVVLSKVNGVPSVTWDQQVLLSHFVSFFCIVVLYCVLVTYMIVQGLT